MVTMYTMEAVAETMTNIYNPNLAVAEPTRLFSSMCDKTAEVCLGVTLDIDLAIFIIEYYSLIAGVCVP